VLQARDLLRTVYSILKAKSYNEDLRRFVVRIARLRGQRGRRWDPSSNDAGTLRLPLCCCLYGACAFTASLAHCLLYPASPSPLGPSVRRHGLFVVVAREGLAQESSQLFLCLPRDLRVTAIGS